MSYFMIKAFYLIVTLLLVIPFSNFCQQDISDQQNTQKCYQKQLQKNTKQDISDTRMRKQTTFGKTVLNTTKFGAKWGAISGTIGGIIATIILQAIFSNRRLSLIALPASIIAFTVTGMKIGLFAGIGIAINNHIQEKRHLTTVTG